MIRLLSGLACLALSWAGLAFAASPPPAPAATWLTPEERDWIRAHPVVRVAVSVRSMPVEYLHDGKLQGLSAEYLAMLSRQTGLSFTYVEGEDSRSRIDQLRDGQVDLVSAARSIGGWQRMDGVSYTPPYHSSAVIVVTRDNQRIIFDLSDLNGKRVAIPFNAYRPLLEAHAPDSRIIVSRSAMEALAMVAEGSADATIGPQSHLAPYLQREYESILQISGVVNGMATEIAMAVREDNPMLYSIVQKFLASITPDQGFAMQRRLLDTTDFGALSLKVFAEHYTHEFALAALVLALLLGLMWQAHRQRQRAMSSEREKAMFLAVMSHEIRSPMNAMLAAVELLRYTRLDERQRHFTDLANTGANTIFRLLDDVLDISKLEAGKLKLHLEPVDLPALARDVIDLYQLRAMEKGIALTLDILVDSEPLMLDASRLAQVLHNLVSNAITFTHTGGVDVRIAQGGHARGKRLEIVVTDSGIGIPEAQQARLFRPYAQTDQPSRRSGGTGLGLSICRELATLMRGTIALRSVQGIGTTVTVTLPVSAAGPHAMPAVKPVLASAPGPVLIDRQDDVHILIVEDSPANQAALADQVRSFGCRPQLARDGAEAMALFESREFDLVLLDCHLPDTDGYALASALRAHEAREERANCAIIAISAATGNEHIERCFGAGMDGALSKPIRISRLRDTVELWCGRTVGRTPAIDDVAHGFSPQQIRNLMADDVAALLGALVLKDGSAGMRAAHRVHGAALTLGWTDMARAAGVLEGLLRSGVAPDHAATHEAQQVLASYWRDICEGRTDTLSGTRI